MKKGIMRFMGDLRIVFTFLILSQLCMNSAYAQASEQRKADSLSRSITPKAAIHVDHTGERILSGNVFIPDGNYRSITMKLRNAEGAEILKIIPDDKGNFKVVLDWSKKPVSIFVTAYGYQPELVFLNNLSSLQSVKISLVKMKHHASQEVIQKE